MLRKLTGLSVKRWHNVELPLVQNRRVDMLGETADGTLLHIELQSTNHRDMALRMLGYSLAIYRQFRRFPRQMVLYVGEPPLRMKDRISGPGLEFCCRMVDIRVLDGDELIASEHVEDNVIAVLARFLDEREAVRRILQRIARSGRESRTAAIDELTLLAGLRELGQLIKQETIHMPILDDIMDHDLYGPLLRQGREEGERGLVLDMISKRFGPLSRTAKKQIQTSSAAKIKRMALRLLDARSLEDVLKVRSTNGKSAVRARK